ncbi:MAG TPA: BTAD domain-containing putative transcriptional regulator [Candidatus Cybelea sp.]|nr:BTAD domain-containing putative transcriptional regulator [Candidatus Cybelea sp.]
MDAESRERVYAEASTLAPHIDSEGLRSSLLAAWHKHGPAGMLSAFVGRFRESDVGALKVELLAARIVRRGVPVRLTRREFELIAFMALRRRPAMAAEVLEAIWPDQGETSNVLRVYATRLRGRLGSDALERTDEGYCIGQPATVDLFEIDSLCKRFCREQGGRTLTLLRDAFEALSRGVPSWLSSREWFQPYLARIEEVRRGAGLIIARDALDRGAFETAIATAEKLLSLEPCDETARELSIRARLAQGDKSGALREYRVYRDALSSQLGVEAPKWLRSLAVHGAEDVS